jgi:hypothetical protein
MFEKNRMSPWKNNAWHARAELRMFRLTVTGKMEREVAACAHRECLHV